MSKFEFNKIYVLESLDENEEQLTGKELYDDLLRWKEYEFAGKFKAELIQIHDKIDFFKQLNKIKIECIDLKYYPILHLEIHGSNDTSGLILKSGELVKWAELYDILSDINLEIGNNLFLTLAVCHGAYLMQLISLNKPAPFYGFIGSFDEIGIEDLLIRYNEFYKEFLSSFKLDLAFEKLIAANPSIPSTYRYISSEETFKHVYDKYLKENTSLEGIEKRKTQVIKDENLKFTNRAERRGFEKMFAKKILETREKYYKEHSAIFFMLKRFPKNRQRFNVREKL